MHIIKKISVGGKLNIQRLWEHAFTARWTTSAYLTTRQ